MTDLATLTPAADELRARLVETLLADGAITTSPWRRIVVTRPSSEPAAVRASAP